MPPTSSLRSGGSFPLPPPLAAADHEVSNLSSAVGQSAFPVHTCDLTRGMADGRMNTYTTIKPSSVFVRLHALHVGVPQRGRAICIDAICIDAICMFPQLRAPSSRGSESDGQPIDRTSRCAHASACKDVEALAALRWLNCDGRCSTHHLRPLS